MQSSVRVESYYILQVGLQSCWAQSGSYHCNEEGMVWWLAPMASKHGGTGAAVGLYQNGIKCSHCV